MKVTNRSASVVRYSIPDLNINRRFAPGESKNISKEEVEKLQFQPGGLYILANFLQVSVEDAKSLDIHPEREYYLSTEGVKELILTAPVDEFLDALDFAPKGVIDLIKELSVSLPIADLQKAEALKEKAGFDALKALEFSKLVKAEEAKDKPVTEKATVRRTEAAKVEEPASAPKRRVAEDKYKIVTSE